MTKHFIIFILLICVSCTQMNSTLVIGHRGAMGHETENSLASINKALDLGVDMIEIDVFKTKDNAIVVFHDDQVDRLTNGTGNIEEYTLEELLKLNLIGGHKIPTLLEVIKTIGVTAQLNIELKGDGTVKEVNNILEKYIKEETESSLNNYLISSFKWGELQNMRIENKAIKIAILTEENPLDAIEIAKELNAIAINPDFTKLSQESVSAIQGYGYKVYPWTINTKADIEKAKRWGVDGIITNFPERIK